MKFQRTFICAAMALCAAVAGAAEVARTGGPYVPTPPAVVEKMLEVAGVGPRDFVVDLGSGDGRIVLAAATRYKASGMGVEIDPELVEVANALARKQGVADRARFLRQDVMKADLSRATVLTLYLLPGMMTSLRPKLLAELKPGSRVVSHDFGFEQWKPDRSVTVETREKYDVTGVWSSDVHLWVVPADVQGAWRVTRAGEKGEPARLEIRQSFQRFEGRYSLGAREVSLRDGRLDGARLSFTVSAGNGRSERYSAMVERDRMNGDVRDGEALVARWSATRLP